MRDLKRVDSISVFADACAKAGTTQNEAALVGVATSMEKLFPRAMPVTLRPPTTIDLSLGRNETESVQIGVLPLREALRNVSVQVGALRSDMGEELPDEAIACDVVGFVETKGHPPYGSPLVGWWPDPLLDFIGPVDIAPGDLQGFWIRVRAPKGQAPGIYRGGLTVDGEGMNAVRIPMTVTVRNFTLPDVSPLPEAISFGSPIRPYSMLLEDLIATPEWDSTLKYRWADFLADYYISYDHLYRRSAPDFEVLDYLNAQGRLGTFNLGYCGIEKTEDGHARPEDLENYRDGLEDYAYVRLLEEAVHIRQAQGTALLLEESARLAKAKTALEVPGDMVASVTEYSRDPARLYAWRETIAALIEDSKLPDLNPWKEPFSLHAPSGRKE